jgi:hypothetical protein
MGKGTIFRAFPVNSFLLYDLRTAPKVVQFASFSTMGALDLDFRTEQALAKYRRREIFRLRKNPSEGQGASGHDFSRAATVIQNSRALQAAEDPFSLKGHDFSRAANA